MFERKLEFRSRSVFHSKNEEGDSMLLAQNMKELTALVDLPRGMRSAEAGVSSYRLSVTNYLKKIIITMINLCFFFNF